MKNKTLIKYITLLGTFCFSLGLAANNNVNKIIVNAEGEEPGYKSPFSDLSTKASLSFCYNDYEYPMVQVTSKDEINQLDSYTIISELNEQFFG